MFSHLKAGMICLVIIMLFLVSNVYSKTPKLINYQGRATNASGNAVTDGLHNVWFFLYTSSSGATYVWSDNASIQTSGGLFNYTLGSDPTAPLDDSLFIKYDSLFLGVIFDGEQLTPLTPLTTAPYAFRVNTIDSANGGALRGNIRLVDTTSGIPFAYINKDQWNLSGNLYLRKSPTDIGMLLYGNFSNMGNPYIYMNGNTTSIVFNLNEVGNATAVFPNSAIHSLEIANEPGVGSYINETGYSVLDGLVYLGSRAMFSPSAGYVLVIASAQLSISHEYTYTDGFYFGVTDDCGMLYESSRIFVHIPSSYPTGSLSIPITVHGLFPVDSGTTTFCFMAEHFSAGCTVENISISELFVPTAYTTVISPISSSSPGDIESERATEREFHEARLQAELDNMKAEMEEIKKELDRVMKTNQ